MSTGGLRFREVSREVGIDFVHRPTRVDPLVAGIAAQITGRRGGGLGGRRRRRRLAGPLRREQRARRAQRPVPQPRRRHLRGAGRARRAGGPEPRGRGVLDGLGVGRLRRRPRRGRLRLRLGAPALAAQRRRARVHRRHRGLRARGVDELQRRHLARLRPRRAPRPVRDRVLLRGARPVEPRDHAHHAGQLRVLEERRAGTGSSAGAATGPSRTSAIALARTARAGPTPPWRPTSTATAGRTCTWPTTTVPRSSS